MINKCLSCYLPLNGKEIDFHSQCSKKIFGQPAAPILPFSEEKMEELAGQIIKSQTTVTGVQPKLSLHLDNENGSKEPKRFTIVGLWGAYILKPPTANFPQLPQVEDLTMHLAAIAKIKVVPHALIRMQSGNLAYITKRIDRINETKLHMEDMCQLTERLSEHKYLGSYENIAKTILKYSVNPGLDLVNFFELILFSFLTGNADMHLKNFSLICEPGVGIVLAPAYDLIATKLVNPADNEDMALTLNGKKNKIKRADFTAVFNNFKLENKQQENIFKKMVDAKTYWFECIERSFLDNAFKVAYKEMLIERYVRISG